MTQKKGMRKGIDTKQIMKKLSDDDWRRIQFWKEIEEKHVEDKDAFKCAVRTDQLYQQWDEKLGVVQGEMFQILSLKSRYDKNKQQIAEGLVTDVYPGSNILMTSRDLEIQNIMNNQKIGESLRKLWLVLSDLYRYVEQLRLDRKVFFSKEQYTKFIEGVKNELAKESIDLYQERV